VHSEKPTTHERRCGTPECATGKRNRYFRSKSLKAEEFQIEQAYMIERRRLVNRHVLGWGVVAGFRMHSDSTEPWSGERHAGPEPIGVGKGFALDRHGREIVLIDTMMLDATNTFLREPGESGCRIRDIRGLAPGTKYVLAIHYAERRIGDAHLSDGCGSPRTEKNFVCETALFSLTELCGEAKCPCGEPACDRHCRCGTRDACKSRGRGPHACLTEWVTSARVESESMRLCDWSGHWVDPDSGVALACITITGTAGDCDPPLVGTITDDRGPRRLVKNNDLLYDLARGCDLTHIASISWAGWHRSKDPISWEDFAARFFKDGMTTFQVTFSGPVREETIQPDCMVMSVFMHEQPNGWRSVRRVPIVDIITTPHSLPGMTESMTLKVSAKWLREEVQGDVESWFSSRQFAVEIEVRGDFILDCHWQAVDANAVGRRAAPSGNGTPGGTFLSHFRVTPKPVYAETERE